jgi:hypothetical protein
MNMVKVTVKITAKVTAKITAKVTAKVTAKITAKAMMSTIKTMDPSANVVAAVLVMSMNIKKFMATTMIKENMINLMLLTTMTKENMIDLIEALRAKKNTIDFILGLKEIMVKHPLVFTTMDLSITAILTCPSIHYRTCSQMVV